MEDLEIKTLLEIKQDLGSIGSSLDTVQEDLDELKAEVDKLKSQVSFWRTVITTLRGVWYLVIALVSFKLAEAAEFLGFFQGK